MVKMLISNEFPSVLAQRLTGRPSSHPSGVHGYLEWQSGHANNVLVGGWRTENSLDRLRQRFAVAPLALAVHQIDKRQQHSQPFAPVRHRFFHSLWPVTGRRVARPTTLATH